MKKDLVFEKISQVVHESLKDHPNTIIHHDYKIPNQTGRKRQIDILIETKINGIKLLIAIECKDYNRKIEAGKIEEFYGKCQRISNINKKLFITRKGYQADAINAAKDFNIELLLLEELNEDHIQNWLKMPMIKQTSIEFICSSLGFDFMSKTKIKLSYDDSLFFKDSNTTASIKDFLMRVKTDSFNPFVIPLDKDKNVTCVNVNGTFTNTFLIRRNKKYELKAFYIVFEIHTKDLENTFYFDRYKNYLDDSSEQIEIASSVTPDNNILSLVKREGKEAIEIFKSNGDNSPFKFAEFTMSKNENKTE